MQKSALLSDFFIIVHPPPSGDTGSIVIMSSVCPSICACVYASVFGVVCAVSVVCINGFLSVVHLGIKVNCSGFGFRRLRMNRLDFGVKDQGLECDQICLN